ncbi:MAG: MMPL family transporter [Gammaproteobacteria bacterium]|nr:MMPL family transporter [Gammaproteobacteria bacterium]MDH3857995.1 MMPL family transporter [Gammaproteobacteria bacterium]
MLHQFIAVYNRLVLKQPLATLIVIISVVAFFLLYIPDFELDASADSLVLENDASLKSYRGIREQYGSDDFLIVTYSPEQPLFSQEVIADITRLRDLLIQLEQVDSVISMLDVPLVDSPPMTLAEISRKVRTLESEDVNIQLAEQELRQSPLYENLLVNSEGDTTAMQVNLVTNQHLLDLINNRDKLYEKVGVMPDATERVKQLTAQIKIENQAHKIKLDQTIVQVRDILDAYRAKATVFLGGVPMITSDSIEFIRSDLKVFGVGVILFIVIILALSFKHVRWVVLPLAVCLTSAMTMMGYLGWAQWPVTVVSSNFISLLLIITLSLIIHLVVRYRELVTIKPGASQYELVSETVQSKFSPSFYTAVTTMVAFGSLLVSGIRPVIDFGWMMVIGISVSFVLAFTLFPAALMLLPRLETRIKKDLTGTVTASIANFIQHRTRATLLIFVLLTLIALTGIPRLSVENRFIDYYKESTEIYQGMTLIDTKLGGTTPMDVVIDAPADEVLAVDELFGDGDITSSSYWFNRDGLREVAKIHDYLDKLPETGKVLSVHTGMKLLESLNNGRPYNDFKLAVVYKRLPEDVKKALISPYLSPDGNQLRFSIRLYESSKTLRRQELIEQIYNDLTGDFELAPEQVTVSGIAVLYNNLLQSLFRSQILTLGAVFCAILVMFIVLFRAVRLSFAALVPNIISAGLILGLMGWIGIPLDIMTITIAAINIGIGVDDSIHYIHRFRGEFLQDRNYWAAIARCHNSIARAMYYTSVTVVLGFSILALSNFIPTIYFGVLCGLAMITALIANLMLLPILIARFRLS